MGSSSVFDTAWIVCGEYGYYAVLGNSNDRYIIGISSSGPFGWGIEKSVAYTLEMVLHDMGGKDTDNVTLYVEDEYLELFKNTECLGFSGYDKFRSAFTVEPASKCKSDDELGYIKMGRNSCAEMELLFSK